MAYGHRFKDVPVGPCELIDNPARYGIAHSGPVMIYYRKDEEGNLRGFLAKVRGWRLIDRRHGGRMIRGYAFTSEEKARAHAEKLNASTFTDRIDEKIAWKMKDLPTCIH